MHAHIVGEHGDSDLPNWSHMNIAGVSVQLPEDKKERIFVNTRHAVHQIIRAKGATYYAIALTPDRICAAILRDESSVLNISTLVQNYHGISDVYLGLPCIVGRSGVQSVVDLLFTESEFENLRKSA